MKMMPVHRPPPGMSIYNVQSEWQSQSGATFKTDSLRGRPVLAAMIYTHCKDVCPLITLSMQQIEHALPESVRSCTQFVLFSMDWLRDTPGELRAYANARRLDSRNWTLLHGDEAAVREISAALGIALYRRPNGDYQHAIAIFLLNPDGVVSAEQTDLHQSPRIMANKISHMDREYCEPIKGR